MRSSSLFALLALPAQLVFAQAPTQGGALSLDDAIRMAQQNNPAFQQIKNTQRQLKRWTGAISDEQKRLVDETMQHASPQIVVTFDGTRVEPYTLVNIEPGTHAVHVEAPGYKPFDLQQKVVQGTTNMIDVALDPKPAKVSFDVEADARISIDGRPIGTTPLTIDVPAGPHIVTILHRGREPIVRELTFDRGQQLSLRQPLVMTARRRAVPYVAYTASGIALVSAGVLSDLRLVN